MINKLNIGPRLLVLLAAQFIVLIVVAGIVFSILRSSVDATQSLSHRVTQQAKLIALSEGLRNDFISTVHALNVGTLSWEEAGENVGFARDDLDIGWRDFIETVSESPAEREFVDDVLSPHLQGVQNAFTQLTPILEVESRSKLALFVSNDLEEQVGPFLNALVASTSLQQLEAAAAVTTAGEWAERFLYLTLSLIAIGALIAGLLGFVIYRSIVNPLRAIAATVEDVSEGNFDARSGVVGTDELATLGGAFDDLLDDRVAALQKAQAENDTLNMSVITLLEAVSTLAQRDLRMKVPVTEDIIGPVADSLNLLTSETASVLSDVRSVSNDVARASKQVKAQSDKVIQVASEEQKKVQTTAEELADAAQQMTRIAQVAQACASSADKAIVSTQTALETVNGTVTGINAIRDTIREAEKRIKRLGERSQEISGVVDMINTIAERTHILALNASMHAASAGEAGRGFAVVADEVQRLAENAREATSQIATLVRNIQVETADTVTTMNEVISQVVDGSELAEQAGEEMENTRKSTADLVAMVQKIATGSKNQARVSVELEKRAQEINASTRQTSDELVEQSTHTATLMKHSRQLLDAVNVFKLPGADGLEDVVEIEEEPTVSVAVFPTESPHAVNG